jgi:uncharacterized coiled-coil DUF342 family protein
MPRRSATLCSMSPRIAELLHEIKQLPKEERDEIRAELDELDSAEDSVPSLHSAWHDELVSRIKSLKDGSAELHDWEDVKRELDEIVGD